MIDHWSDRKVTELLTEIDPDSDSGYCSPKQRGPLGNKCPAELTEAHLGQKDSETQIQQPSYSQILKGAQNQPPDQGKHFTNLYQQAMAPLVHFGVAL